MLENSYTDKTAQKAYVEGVHGCVEHVMVVQEIIQSFSFVLPATRQIEVILTRILEGLNLFLNLNNHRWQQFQTLSVRRQASTEVNIKMHI